MAIYKVEESTVATNTFQSDLKLVESPLYGSSRLGMCTYDTLTVSRGTYTHDGSPINGAYQNKAETLDVNTLTPPSSTDFEHELGPKRYELANHLGNVLAVVSDRKNVYEYGTLTYDPNGSPNAQFNQDGSLSLTSGDYTVSNSSGSGSNDFYTADIVAAYDYYPFGMIMPGREFVSEGYRYGFQGQERDDEIKGSGNSINFKYRIHDPRLGRFFAADPLSRKYPWNSPFAFSENKVIQFIELEGLEVFLSKAQRLGYVGPYTTYPGTFLYNSGVSLYNGFVDAFNYAGELDLIDNEQGTVFSKESVGKVKQDVTNVANGVHNYVTTTSFDQFTTDVGNILSTVETYENITGGLMGGAAMKGARWLIAAKATGKVGAFVRLTSITDDNIDLISRYLKTLDPDAANDVMVDRLKRISSGDLNATDVDIDFYNHELREMQYKATGVDHQTAHTSTLKDQGIEYKAGYESRLYTEDALKAGDEGLINEVDGQ